METALSFTEVSPGLPSVEHMMSFLQNHRKWNNLAFALRIHTEVSAHGLEAKTELGNYLVPIFVKCDRVTDAHRIFRRLVFRKEYSWTSLIQGYVQSGECEVALNLLPQMWDDHVAPSHYTYVALAKACATMGDLEKGKEVHTEIAQEGFEGDPFVGNTLVDMYAKCSSLMEAQDVFDSLSSQDVVSWNALIAGYADNLFAEEVFKCQEQMQTQGFQLNEVTYLSCLKACGSIGDIDIGQELHSEIVERELDQYPFVCNGLIDMYVKCGHLSEAQGVFDDILAPDIVSWTSIIAGYTDQALGDKAVMCMERMLRECILPNKVTYIYVLKACSIIKGALRGQEVHCEIVKRGFERDSVLGSSLVEMYTKCSLLMEAQNTFDKLPVKDTVCWNALISSYVEAGLGNKGLEGLEKLQSEGLSPNANTFACILRACSSIGAIKEGQKLHNCIVKEGFDNFFPVLHGLIDLYSKCGWLAEAWEEFLKLSPVQDVQVWNTLISGLVEHGGCEKALSLFACMQEQGLLPDNGIFSNIIKACGITSALELGKRLHSQVGSSRYFDGVIGIAIIDMYSKCGAMIEKHLLFDQMPAMDIKQWTAIITGYARLGETDLVLTSFEQMREKGVYPNEVTFLSVLSTCTHAGLVEQGRKYYDCMRKEFSIPPTTKHYNCMLDLLIRAGQFDDALVILEEMPTKDHATWGILLGACKEWCDKGVARRAFDCALIAHDNHATPFILMHNLLGDTAWS